MSLTTSKITDLAPDQDSLNAANKLMRPDKWPLLRKHSDLVWGECQGSGANPYRTVFDHANAGYKCTCPSRKFPCKHVLALMWMYVEDPKPFAEAEVPTWVTDWLGRRRGSDAASSNKTKVADSGGEHKSLAAAVRETPESRIDPQAEVRQRAISEKRAQATQQSIAAGLEELEQWISDQMRRGLSSLLNDPLSACRTIASRLVDAKAQAMASRLDELPSRWNQVPAESRLDALIVELGRTVLLCRAWKKTPKDAELARLIGSSETRESVLALTDNLRVHSTWEVVGEQVSTRRDGLVKHATWLMNIGEGARFGLLLDYFPASLGKRSSTFSVGERFEGELAYYPARHPLRAVIVSRKETPSTEVENESAWPTPDPQPLRVYQEILQRSPWVDEVPLLLPPGRVGLSPSRCWWIADDQSVSLPLSEKPSKLISGLALQRTVALWDGVMLTLLSGVSDWGRWSHDR